MKILITGGAGYIGSLLTEILLKEKGYKITVYDNYFFNQSSLFNKLNYNNFKLLKKDVRDAKDLISEVKKNDVIIPLAALVGAPICDKYADLVNDVNTKQIKHIVENISNDQKLLIPISNSGYGIGEEGKYLDENSPLNPISLYGKSKVLAEKIALKHNNSISFRLATVFGCSERMRMDLMVNDFVYRAFKERKITLFESHFRRNYVHIYDVCRLFKFAIENFDHFESRVFNVGLSNANLTKKKLCEKIKEHIPDLRIVEDEFKKDPDKRNYYVSNERLEKTGFKMSKNLDEGIKELLYFYNLIDDVSKYKNV